MKNIYEGGDVAAQEAERLKGLEYPVKVSEELVGEDLDNKTVLDLGSGPNESLGDFVLEHGGRYFAYDINEIFLKMQQEHGVDVVRGAIGELPFKEGAADVVHTRFVLMHLTPEQRREAIREAVGVAKERAIFLEYDWGSMEGNELITEFKDFATNFMRMRGIDFYMGQKLKAEIEAVIGENLEIEEKRYTREAGNYYNEIIPLAKSLKEIIGKMEDNEELLAKLDELSMRLEEESKKEGPSKFTRPDIVAVEVDKG